jgi:hypothetical protein
MVTPSAGSSQAQPLAANFLSETLLVFLLTLFTRKKASGHLDASTAVVVMVSTIGGHLMHSLT